jgi:hypothetical protein
MIVLPFRAFPGLCFLVKHLSHTALPSDLHYILLYAFISTYFDLPGTSNVDICINDHLLHWFCDRAFVGLEKGLGHGIPCPWES